MRDRAPDLTGLLLIELLDSELRQRHGTHDQSSHGSWSVGNLDAAPGVGADVDGVPEDFQGELAAGNDIPDLSGANRKDVDALMAGGAIDVVAKVIHDKEAAIGDQDAMAQLRAREGVKEAAKQAINEQAKQLPAGVQQQFAEDAVGDLNEAVMLRGDAIHRQGTLNPNMTIPNRMGGGAGGGGGGVDHPQTPDLGGPDVSDDGQDSPIDNVIPGVGNADYDDPVKDATSERLFGVVSGARNATGVKDADEGVQGVTFATLTDPADGSTHDVVVRENSPGLTRDAATKEFAAGRVALAGGMDEVMPGMTLVNPDPNLPEAATNVQERFGPEFQTGNESGVGVFELRDMNEADVSKIGALDYITTNSDRHGGNYMVDTDTGRVRAIDHGLAFGEANPDYVYEGGPGDNASSVTLDTMRSPFAQRRSSRRYMVEEVDWNSVERELSTMLDEVDNRDLPATDAETLRLRLETSRRLAERASRGEFHANGSWMTGDDFINDASV